MYRALERERKRWLTSSHVRGSPMRIEYNVHPVGVSPSLLRFSAAAAVTVTDAFANANYESIHGNGLD